jgi:hypothetical protein
LFIFFCFKGLTHKKREKTSIKISKYARWNDGVKFLLIFIDVFSRFLWVKPLKQKNMNNMYKAFKEMIDNEWFNKPKILACDRGTEYVNKLVKNLLKENNIQMFHTTDEGKAVYAERVNGTLQNLIYRYMTEYNTKRYIDVLSKLVETYNKRDHRSLKFLPPREAERDQNILFFRRLFRQKNAPIIEKGIKKKRKPRFKVGDVVRIHAYERKFTKRSYSKHFNEELFIIVQISYRLPIPLYRLQALNNNEILEGDFYANELQLVKI